MDPELEALRKAWLSSRAFADEQPYLRALVDAGEADYVCLDADGTMAPWLFVVIRRETGVVYGNQCAGVGCDQRMVEGYLMPLGGVDEDFHAIQLRPFTDVFHANGGCQYNWRGRDLPDVELRRLRRLVSKVPVWYRDEENGKEEKTVLQLDEAHLDEVAEAWVPVLTPYGRGVLLYKNCD